MAALLIAAIFSASVLVTLSRGLAGAFVYVYLPVLLLLAMIPPFDLPYLPDVHPAVAVSYGAILGWAIKGGETLHLRWHPIDLLLVGLIACKIVTSLTTEQVWTGVNTFGTEVFGTLLPYLMARVAFADAGHRRAMLWIVCGCMAVVGFFALVELRLWPYFYSRNLQRLGMVQVANGMVLKRFGLFRGQVSFAHPIDLGNGAVILASLIGVLAWSTRTSLRNPWVVAGLGGCAAAVLGSMSFTSYLAAAVAAAVLAGLYYGRRAAALLVMPGAVAMGVVGVLITTYLINDTIGAKPEEGASTLEASIWVRTLIVQSAWKLAQSAGFFGYGRLVDSAELGVTSLDNAYLLLLLRYGWVYLIGWVGLIFTLAAVGTRGLLAARTQAERLPMMAGLTGILAIAVGMYTIWFGFVYADLFLLNAAVVVTMSQMLAGTVRGTGTAAAPAAVPTRAVARPGRPVGPVRVPAGV